MAQNVFIVGATGNVGRKLVSQMIKEDTNPKKHRNPTRFFGVASSSSALLSSGWLDEEKVRDFSLRRIEGIEYKGIPGLTELFRHAPVDLTIIDVTATGAMLDLYTAVIRDGRHGIVTANKTPLVEAPFDTFQELVTPARRFGYRCSVMAGAEAVEKVRDLRDLGNPPTGITGVFSGTLGFIVTELQKGRKFSEILNEAIELGYTEPDPRIDLSGGDVAKKILILARTAMRARTDGNEDEPTVHMSDVRLQPFVPTSYMKGELSDFMGRLGAVDDYFSGIMDKLARKGKVLGYVATYENVDGLPKISVGKTSESPASAFGQLTGPMNMIEIVTNKYGPNYTSVKAQGAGLDITAENVRRDALTQIDNRRLS